jgi:hypothetical protein
MNDTLYHYIDPGFSHTAVGNYTLLLLLGTADFQLAVMQDQKLLVWRKTAPLAEFTQPGGEVQEVLGFEYRDVITGICTPYFTLVPEELFDPSITTEVARYLDVQLTDSVFAQPLDTHNQIVFKTNKALSTAAARFDLQKVVFGASGWIQAIAANTPLAYNLYLNLHDDRFDLAYFRQGKLHLYNTFEYTHEDELAYYTVFACRQLKLNVAQHTVVISGALTATNDGCITLLGSIFDAVEINSITVATIPQTLPVHQLLALTALPLCASLADA